MDYRSDSVPITFCDYCISYFITSYKKQHFKSLNHWKNVQDCIAEIKRKKCLEENSWKVSRIMI